ncbi:related to Mig2 protein [Ustilago bromivora]|uniref:Related to Mig2 protein n=1 Tax=Ustilago bromivora TaxID=307758 RepID=A0A1K0GDZ1_9BASI|nr:related to Mig2 protein [Ustilago bromivora]
MFPKSLLFAFVASSLFLTNVGVEASARNSCLFPFANYDVIFSPANGPNALPVQKFLAEAQKTAKCAPTFSFDVNCVEQGEKEDMDVNDTIWWQHAFCKRCSHAGGTNAVKFQCPKVDAAAGDKGEGAQSREGSKEGSKKADGGLV